MPTNTKTKPSDTFSERASAERTSEVRRLSELIAKLAKKA